jgi:hypothetical protein
MPGTRAGWVSMPDTTQPPARRAFVNRLGDNHIDVRLDGKTDFVISWRHVDPYVTVFAFAWPMFASCADIFAWLAGHPGASRDQVAAALLELGYSDDTQPVGTDDETQNAIKQFCASRGWDSSSLTAAQCQEMGRSLGWGW